MSLSTNVNLLEDDIKQVVKPLFDHFEIQYFSFSRHFKSNKREVFNLTTNLNKAEETAKNVSSVPIFGLIPEGMLLTSVYEHIKGLKDPQIKRVYDKQIHLQKDKYGINSELTFLKWSSSYVDLYEVAFCGLDSFRNTMRAIENQDLIHHFMNYFSNQLSDILTQAYQNRLIYSNNLEGLTSLDNTFNKTINRNEFIKSTMLKKFKGYSKNNLQVLLTHKEWLITVYLNSGYVSSKYIAKQLSLSPRTVEMHIGNLLKKFECSHKAELVQYIKTQNILLI